eukprot:scaffold49344_cov88-Cyclotella_meneghiniana.AAC.1
MEYNRSCPNTSTTLIRNASMACVKYSYPVSSIHPGVLTIIPEERASTSEARRASMHDASLSI